MGIHQQTTTPAPRSASAPRVEVAANWESLFPGRSADEFVASGSTLTATRIGHDRFELRNSTVNRSDGRCFGTGHLAPAEVKLSPSAPDMLGQFEDPKEFDGHQPTRYRVAAWWKPIRTGNRAGRMYLRVALTPLAS